jgi:ABC-type sugar transport system permease subunit
VREQVVDARARESAAPSVEVAMRGVTKRFADVLAVDDAFALSFDEIVVTTFTAGTGQTLPLWIFSNLFRPNQLPIVNAVATAVVVLSIVPVYFAQRLTEVGTTAS